jgi:hypothetical protein
MAKGERLLTANGTPATVIGGSVPAVHDGWMWDLTVSGDNDHDFYVIAGSSIAGDLTPILVHNDGPASSQVPPAPRQLIWGLNVKNRT